MDIEDKRRSDNFEDRGTQAGGSRGGGLPVQALGSLIRVLGFKGTLIVGGVLGAAYLFLPGTVRQQLLGVFGGGGQTAPSGKGSVCSASPKSGAACDFSRVVLASTEDVWKPIFAQGLLPSYRGAAPRTYTDPTLVVFSRAVSTGGCGNATSDVGPFYCPGDRKLYIDPSFYDVMEKRLRAPGDFAQAYVIAHEVGHHVQNLIGASDGGKKDNQASVRVELQADCFAGVWGHSARASLKITDADLGEAMTAAHAIGDDTLGHTDERTYTHGTSAQRMRWFRRGFDSGDARQCDTFAVRSAAEL